MCLITGYDEKECKHEWPLGDELLKAIDDNMDWLVENTNFTRYNSNVQTKKDKRTLWNKFKYRSIDEFNKMLLMIDQKDIILRLRVDAGSSYSIFSIFSS